MADIRDYFENKAVKVIDPNDQSLIPYDNSDDPKKPKELPNSKISEQCLLAALMNEKDGTVWELVSHLRKPDFYYPRHQAIFSAMAQLVDTGTPIDIVTTAETLNNLGKLKQVGDIQYLTDLIMQSPSTANAKEYAAIILQKSFRRNVIELGRELSDSGSSDKSKSPEKMLEEIQQRLRGLERYIDEGPNGKLNIFNYDKDFDFSALDPDAWIIENLIMRGMVTLCVAPGGVGKSIHNLALAISVASGKDFLGLGISETCNVLSINNEDPRSIIDRRVGGILGLHNIPTESIEGKFYCLSGYGDSFTVAVANKDGSVLQAPKVKTIIDFIRENEIGCVWIDPFISTHNSNENDNSSIEQVCNQYRHIAEETNCAIVIIHHTGKSKFPDNSEYHIGNLDSARGASSLTSSIRVGFTLAQMNGVHMDEYGIPKELGRHLYRQDGTKANYSAMDYKECWFKKESYETQNGISSVGVPVPFDIRPYQAKSIQKSDNKKAVKKGLTTSDFLEKVNDFWLEKGIKGTEIQEKLMIPDLSVYLGVSQRTVPMYFSSLSGNKKEPTTILKGGVYIQFCRYKKQGAGPSWYVSRQ